LLAEKFLVFELKRKIGVAGKFMATSNISAGAECWVLRAAC